MPGKRKIVSSKRSAFWPCGSCRQNCKTESICCDACKRWHHASCEGLTDSEFSFFNGSDASYTCNDCFSIELGNSPYQYSWALTRLRQWSSRYGVDGLRYAARRESLRCPPFRYYGQSPVPAEFAEVDLQAQDILKKANLLDVGIPALSTGDGNCLFNSVSTALTADETLAAELRLRTAIEMSVHSVRYTARRDFGELLACSPSFEESMMDACTDGAYMAVWNMIALANVIGSPIQSVYPRLNGQKDKTPQFLNKIFQPEENRHNERISILWSRLGPCRGRSWTTNHFVPLLRQQSTDAVMPPTNPPEYRSSTPKPESTKPRLSTITEFMSPPTKRPRTASTLPTVTVIQQDPTTPKHDMRRLSTITMMDQRGEEVKITAVPNVLLPEANARSSIDECITETTETHDNEVTSTDFPVPPTEGESSVEDFTTTEFPVSPITKNTTIAKLPVPPTANVSMYFDEDNSFTEQSESRYPDTTKRELLDPPATNVSMNIVADESIKQVEESESSVEDFTTTELPVPPTAKPLRQGRWLSKEELYQLVIEPTNNKDADQTE